MPSILSKIGSALGAGIPTQRLRTPPFLPSVSYGEDPAGDTPDESQPSIGSALGSSERVALPRYQEALERNEQIIAERPQKKTGFGRQLAGALIMGAAPLAGPGVLAAAKIGQRVAYGDYPEQLAEWEAKRDLAEHQLKAAKEAEADERQRLKDEETLAATREYRQNMAATQAAAAERAEAERKARVWNASTSLQEEGAKVYTPPSTSTSTIPEQPAEVGGVPLSPVRGLPKTEAAVNPEFQPENVTAPHPDTGKQYVMPPKERTGFTYLEPQEADQLELSGERTPDGRVAVPSSALTAKLRGNRLAFEHHTDEVTGDVTSIGRDPLTGKEVSREVSKGVARKRPPASAAPTNPEGTPAIVFKNGTNEFKVAQDIAYGRLTWSQFRSMMSYNRDINKKMGIYNTASVLNPNFNPAKFEMGNTLAKNPKVQQQLASMDNVERGVEDLLKASDAASRSGVTALNKLIVKGGIAIGNKKYSSFKTAQIGFADELSGALGFGSATDMSRQMGVDMTNENLSPEAFRDAIENVVVPFIKRKRDSLLNQMGPYGTAEFNPAAELSSGKSGNGGDQVITTPDGKKWKQVGGKMVEVK